MIQGGGSRELIRPLLRDGNLRPNVRGCHRWSSEALNVHNPQPGFIYYWCRHPRADRGGAQLQRFLNMGWEPVGPNDPERKGRETSMRFSDLGLDNYQAHGDVVLLRIPESKYRAYREHRARLAAAARTGPTEDFLNKGQHLDEMYAGRADGSIYYRGSGHGFSSQ